MSKNPKGFKHSPAIGEFAVGEVERLRAENAELRAALTELVLRCDGVEGLRADNSNIQTMRAHAVLEKIERSVEKMERSSADEIRAALPAECAPLDHLPVLFYGREAASFIGWAASTHGAEVLIACAGKGALYISRAKLDGREFFIGHN